MRKEPRLQFTAEERSDPVLEKAVRKTEQAADKADKEQAKLPKKTVKVKKTVKDPVTGKQTTTLHFETVEKKKPDSKISHVVKKAPMQAVSENFHKEMRESEQDNVGVESAHRMAKGAETGVHLAENATHSHKLHSYRKAVYAERRLEKANIKALYQKAFRDNPVSGSNPISRWQQKQAIKKQYAVVKYAEKGTAEAVRTSHSAAKIVDSAASHILSFAAEQRRKIIIIAVLLFVMIMLMNSLSSCTVNFQSILSAIASTTYPSKDEDMLGAEQVYVEMEEELQYELDHYEQLHGGYDEYHYDLDEITHDPHVLMSLLTASGQGEWSLGEMQGLLIELFDRQYTLKERIRVVTRHDSDGDSYDYYICYVSLRNFDLSRLSAYVLTEEQLELYAGYRVNLGNRSDLFPQDEYPGVVGRGDYLDYDVPPEALADEQFAVILAEAEKYLGYPYVWGGSSPSTSFDCSGFVSWVINHSGWSVGRLTANGLLNICTPVSSANAKPGDLIFFQGTYNTAGASHVGIYVGNGMMIHCGSPISYASINTDYWQSHYYTYARLP